MLSPLASYILGPYCLLLTGALCLVGAVLKILVPVMVMSWKLSHIPGPPCHGLLSGQGDYFRRLIKSGKSHIMFDVWLDWSHQYGPVFQYRHYHKHVVPIIHDVNSVKRILHDVNNMRYVFKDSLQFYMGRRMLGHDGMLLSTYSGKWKIKKRILRHFLNPRAITSYAGDMRTIIARCLSSIVESTEVNILPIMQNIATDVMGVCLFNYDFRCSINGNGISTISTQIANECFKMMADPTRKLPFQKTAEKQQTYENITKMRNIARERIEQGCPMIDQFTKVFSDVEDVIDDINSLIFAGQDTTSNVMTYALANIADKKNIVSWLMDELDAVQEDADWDTINNLDRLDCVVKETLRLYPSAPVTLRNLHRDEEVSGYIVPAGSTVWLSPYTSGRHPLLWDKPEEFLPERFLNERDPPRGKYFPFMTGPHECSGKHLAMMEFKMVLFHIFKRYEISMINERIPPAQMSITLRPSRPIIMSFKSITPGL